MSPCHDFHDVFSDKSKWLKKLDLIVLELGMNWGNNIYKKIICEYLRDLELFIQFKKHEKHQWRNVTLSVVAGSLTSILEGNEPATLLKGAL